MFRGLISTAISLALAFPATVWAKDDIKEMDVRMAGLEAVNYYNQAAQSASKFEDYIKKSRPYKDVEFFQKYFKADGANYFGTAYIEDDAVVLHMGDKKLKIKYVDAANGLLSVNGKNIRIKTTDSLESVAMQVGQALGKKTAWDFPSLQNLLLPRAEAGVLDAISGIGSAIWGGVKTAGGAIGNAAGYCWDHIWCVGGLGGMLALWMLGGPFLPKYLWVPRYFGGGSAK